MAEFRIDYLEIEWNGSDYNLSGVCNRDASGAAPDIDGIYNEADKSIMFDTGTNSPDNKFVFSCSNVSFTGYSASDMAGLSFGNTANPSSIKKKMGGVLGSSDYPPPTSQAKNISAGSFSPHNTFSSKFRVDKISFTRTDLSGPDFAVSVQLYYSGGAETYRAAGASLVQDTSHQGNWVLAMEVSEQNTPSGPVNLNFTFQHPATKNIDLNAVYPGGIALLVKETLRPWTEVNTKLSAFFILM